MTATYDLADLTINAPADGGVSNVRFFLGDTDVTQPQVQDEEILFAIEIRGNYWGATAMCAWALSSKYARLVSTSQDGVSTQNGEKSRNFALVGQDYDGKEAMRYAIPYSGGISITDMRKMMSMGDRVPELFRIGLFDNPPDSGTNPAIDRPGGGEVGGFNDIVVG
jgi:hypothetical protein